jgi:hypothetical protein
VGRRGAALDELGCILARFELPVSSGRRTTHHVGCSPVISLTGAGKITAAAPHDRAGMRRQQRPPSFPPSPWQSRDATTQSSRGEARRPRVRGGPGWRAPPSLPSLAGVPLLPAPSLSAPSTRSRAWQLGLPLQLPVRPRRRSRSAAAGSPLSLRWRDAWPRGPFPASTAGGARRSSPM